MPIHNGVLHTLAYRERYKEFLKIDFPRIPLPENEEEFVRKGAIGKQLIDLHLMRDTHTWQLTTTFPETGDCIEDSITYKDGRVIINATQYFGNVPEEAWITVYLQEKGILQRVNGKRNGRWEITDE